MNGKKQKESVLKRLTDTNDIRINEELYRPRVEMWIDEWAAWITSHEIKKYNKEFTHFGVGIH